MNNLTKIASLPGSGGGTMSALPPEVVTRTARFAAGGVVKGAPFFEKEAAEAFQPCAVTFRFSEYLQTLDSTTL